MTFAETSATWRNLYVRLSAREPTHCSSCCCCCKRWRQLASGAQHLIGQPQTNESFFPTKPARIFQSHTICIGHQIAIWLNRAAGNGQQVQAVAMSLCAHESIASDWASLARARAGTILLNCKIDSKRMMLQMERELASCCPSNQFKRMPKSGHQKP